MAKKYTVKEGEDLGSIAEKFGMVSWKYLYEINQEAIGDNPDLLRPGTRLEIPKWDSTSGDEKIEEKGASPFTYTGGLRYRYPWVPFSVTLVDEEGNRIPDFEEEREVVIRNIETKEVVSTDTLKSTDALQVLVPDSESISIGIKGFPLEKDGRLHRHPDDQF